MNDTPSSSNTLNMKENQDSNINDEDVNMTSNGFLGGKLFKFRKSYGPQRKFGETLGNTFNQFINVEGSHSTLGTD